MHNWNKMPERVGEASSRPGPARPGRSRSPLPQKISAEDLGYFKASQVSIGNDFDSSFLRIFSEFVLVCILFADLQFNKQG
jgi:hypothetical protein